MHCTSAIGRCRSAFAARSNPRSGKCASTPIMAARGSSCATNARPRATPYGLCAIERHSFSLFGDDLAAERARGTFAMRLATATVCVLSFLLCAGQALAEPVPMACDKGFAKLGADIRAAGHGPPGPAAPNVEPVDAPDTAAVYFLTRPGHPAYPGIGRRGRGRGAGGGGGRAGGGGGGGAGAGRGGGE